ncbi:hypothetical protein S7711_07774 [Stachybotrys chartarum IBT 7711]|uniref:Uncharacterized protein n=1 Tax=Stachybotrys chartarum (strain CBS 109288 / IBT 7711) TaxID=1280523 RepID=A0A084B8Q5_STACB|nr:hypothetical protein S7711_07774 [Stachybotrys chartarum IBT 7711]KFA56530.1 hypothetical protein S40293_01082 [Stachybotrys chartarum IBT 40293]KFA79977.1 hypothetical protein S40288_01866 [Stachybotrys chartarum IBT 40288]
MGNDGGSIPKRSELVKNAARAPTTSELKATVLESLAHAWGHCALSGMPLDFDATVSDYRGRLYHYEAVLKGLMPSDEAPDVTPQSLGIRSLRDVAKLKFSKSGDKWACPISMKEIGPATKAVYLVPCGHVFAEVAMNEIQEKNCPECAEEFSKDNIITILPSTEKEMEKLEVRMENLRAKGLTHTLKKDKSEKKKKRKGDDLKDEEDNAKPSKKNETKKDMDSRISGINNPLAASLTAKVMAEQDERNKRRKMALDAAAPRRTESARG